MVHPLETYRHLNFDPVLLTLDVDFPILDMRPSTLDMRPPTLDLRPSTSDPRPSTCNPRPSTSNPRPLTLDPRQLPKLEFFWGLIQTYAPDWTVKLETHLTAGLSKWNLHFPTPALQQIVITRYTNMCDECLLRCRAAC